MCLLWDAENERVNPTNIIIHLKIERQLQYHVILLPGLCNGTSSVTSLLSRDRDFSRKISRLRRNRRDNGR